MFEQNIKNMTMKIRIEQVNAGLSTYE